MSDKPLMDLIMVACDLRATNPTIFQRLVSAVRSLEVQAIADMVSSDQPHEVFRSQGGVKTIQRLRKHIAECAELRDQYERRANAQR